MVGVISVFTTLLPPPAFTLGSFVLLVLSLVAVKETVIVTVLCVKVCRKKSGHFVRAT